MIRAIGRRLVRALAPGDIRDALADDLDEAFARRATAGRTRAAWWYWRQVLASIGPLLVMRWRRPHAPVSRQEHSMTTMDALMQDVRYAIRLLRRAPGFSLAAIATIALGIGANTSIFSVVYGLLLKPLPYRAPAELVTIWQDLRATGGPADEWATPGNLADWMGARGTFASIASIRGWGPTLMGQGDPQPLIGEQVTREYFDVLGVPPALGRLFRPEDAVPNAPRVVVLSHSAWIDRFGGDSGVLGRSLVLAGEPHEVIGVLPQGFRPIVNARAEVWRPDRLNLVNPSRGAVVLRVVARLQPGVTVDRANATLAALAKQLERRYPESNTGVGFSVVPLHERVVGPARIGVLVLFGAVVLVLLVACANIANLLLARSSGRAREMAVRAALGAGRRRVVRQLLTESLVLSSIGGALGVLLSVWGTRLLVSIAPPGTPRLDEVALDLAVLGCAAGLTIVTGLLFGLAPATHIAAREQTAALKDGGRGSTASSGQRARRALIVAEVAVALVLLVGGGLLLRSFLALQRSDLGFTPDRVLAGFVSVAATKYRTSEARIAFQDRLLERASAIPGVERAALTSVLPLDGGDSDMSLLLEGRPVPGPSDRAPAAWYRVISGGYFEAMGISIRQGRAFDGREAAPAVVVSETFATRHFPGESALGHRMRFSLDGPWFTVVGVAADVKQQGALGSERAQIFLPYWQFPELAGGTNVVLKTSTASESVAPLLARAVRDVDADAPVTRFAPMSELVSASIDQPRFLARITGLFATLATLLAALGVYGVMSYAVAQRLPEMGVRLALGAGRSDVFRLVFADGLRLTGLGLVAGVIAALALAPVMRTLLFEVTPADPATLAGTAGALLAVAALATFIPARRATRIDPAAALRN